MEIKKILDKVNLDVEGQAWDASCYTDCQTSAWSGNSNGGDWTKCKYITLTSASWTEDF